ncbi:uncharacterized protein TOT_020000082 [Theileria orientalis strain Shintoku]|uniref:Cysteine protease TacP n=1 Tax=Theileria orientalis strain Shintoku TaxID=869250 RepID=J4C347_THEOR|nr:uncharacterized protein TOT_020000082 [Theileria orientalis strain Shintoku]BAM39811.1 uncharacterized protein TOT_020000082 [Theileria orientalis strain Shintoku]|eukprot:XP_009690112.1 uncharacterized protein TOT_020000082 [Theileria orientalis strain Shintoku]
MELPYEHFFVRKYSRGNSYTLDEDFKDKKFKVKFINKYFIGICVLVPAIVIGITIFMLTYRPGSKLFKYRFEKPVPVKTLTAIYSDKILDCVKSSELCKDLEGLKLKYLERLQRKLKEKGVEIVDVDDLYCTSETMDKFCHSIKGEKVGLTTKELKTIISYLVDKKIELDDDFEVETIIKFKKFVRTFKKEYANADRYKIRYSYFRRNRVYIETFNSDKDRMYTLGYTSAADRSEVEMTGGILDSNTIKYVPEDDPLSSGYGQIKDPNYYPGKLFDWRDKGVIIPIRDQGRCGSCWAFASADLISAALAIGGGSKLTFSVQQMLDCILPQFRCEEGGVPLLGVRYAITNPYCTEEEYPYKKEDFICKQPNQCKNKLIMKMMSLKKKDLIEHLEREGPFLINMYADKDFMLYKEGIYRFRNCRRSNHAVIVVGHGYDDTHKAHYWIVRNSWGENWGEKGYFRVVNDFEYLDGTKHYYCDLQSKALGLKLK